MVRRLGVALILPLAQPTAHAEVHVVHCLKGCPTGTGDTNDLAVKEVYSLSSNDRTKRGTIRVRDYDDRRRHLYGPSH